MSKKLYEYKKTGGSFLDPENVNSAIRWTMEGYVKEARDKAGKIQPHTDMSGNCGIHLSDCNRWISWDGYASNNARDDFDSMLKKVGTAIEELTKFRMNLLQMQRGLVRHHKIEEGSDDE